MAEIVSQYRIEVKQAVDALNQVAQATDAGAKKSEDLGKKTEQAGQKAVKASSNFANLGKQILAAFGVTAVVATFVNAIRNAVNAAADFEKQMSAVRAISGATDAEMQRLTKSAQSLGASTRYTATQVGQLQEEYARLGFTSAEILAATEATLNLATATGSTLAEAAEVAGSTLRGFGLDASETGRVTDVMAASFSMSSLNMERFRESMKLVAPIANAANIPLETTTALLARLSQVGISGSLAGTALKNLLSKLSDENSTLSQSLGFSVKNTDDLFRAFQQLAQGNIDLTEATELTDERSKAAFLTMISGIDTIEAMNAALHNVTGTTKEMADIMEDNFAGSLTKLSSAWEGFTNKIMGSNGLLRDFVDLLAESVQGLGLMISLIGNETVETMKMRDEMTESVKQQMKLEDDRFKKRIENAEKEGRSDQLLIQVGDEVLKHQERKEKAESRLIEVKKELVKNEKEKQDAISDSLGFDKLSVLAAEQKAEALIKEQIQLEGQVEVLGSAIDRMNRYVDASKKVADGSDGATETATRSIATLSEELKTLKEQFENAEVGGKNFRDIAAKIEAKTLELARAIALVSTDTIDEDTDTPQQTAFNSLMNYKEKREKEQYDERKKQREEFDEWLQDKTDAELAALLQNNLRAVEITKERYAEEMQVASTVLTGIQQLYGAVTSAIIQGHNQELESLDRQLESEQISRENYDQQRRLLERERAKDQKAAAIFSAILGTAIAVVNALQTQPFLPLGPIMAVLAGALGAAQIAAVASQPLPQFAEGGWVDGRGMIQGRAHAQGGVKLEAEGGEFIVNRAASAKNAALIEAINKGMGEAYIMRKWVAPAVDAALLNGWQDVGKSAELNGLTATLKDHNIIRAMDRNRETTAYGFKLLADKLNKRTPKRGGYA